MRIVIKTLVDITKSGARRSDNDPTKIGQQNNFNTLQQIINLRSLIEDNSDPAVETVDIDGMKFGSRFKGEHKVWSYEFTIDRDGVYHKNNDIIGYLKDDFQAVPVVGALTETINKPSVFKVTGNTDKNIIFQTFDK